MQDVTHLAYLLPSSPLGIDPRRLATYITVAEAQQEYFGGKLSLRWWYRAAKTGTIPSVHVGGTVLFKRSDLDMYEIEAGQVKPKLICPAPVKPAQPKIKPLATGYKFFAPERPT